MTDNKRILVGQLLKAHGIKGEVKLKSFTAEPLDVAAYGPVATKDGRRLTFKDIREAGDILIARFEGVTDRTAAEALHGTELYVDRDALPDAAQDEWYLADLVGLDVVGEDGAPLGKLKAVHNFGAGDLLDVERGDAQSVMLPFTDEVVGDVDVTHKRIVIRTSAEAAQAFLAAKPETNAEAEA